MGSGQWRSKPACKRTAHTESLIATFCHCPLPQDSIAGELVAIPLSSTHHDRIAAIH
jgi:hypothetical protein